MELTQRNQFCPTELVSFCFTFLSSHDILTTELYTKRYRERWRDWPYEIQQPFDGAKSCGAYREIPIIPVMAR